MHFAWALKILGMISGVNVKKMFSFFVSHWREVLIILLVATFLYQNKSEVRFFFGAETIPALEADLATVKKNLATCKAGNKELSDAIEANNIRIKEYEELTEDLQASVDTLEDDLLIEREKSKAKVDEILNEPAPESCEKAIDYLRDAGKELTW